MKTDHPSEPAATPGRKPYRFSPSLYQLCVRKVDVQSAPGGGILRRVVKLVFAVFTRGPDGHLVHCAQDRIAEFVILVLTKDEDLGAPGRGPAPPGGPGRPEISESRRRRGGDPGGTLDRRGRPRAGRPRGRISSLTTDRSTLRPFGRPPARRPRRHLVRRRRGRKPGDERRPPMMKRSRQYSPPLSIPYPWTTGRLEFPGVE